MFFRKKSLLTDSEKQQVIAAIRAAEMQTSGEIRVHIEEKCSSENPLQRATFLFAKLKMEKTTARNGTLIYVAIRDKKFSILGDKGIHEKVGEYFWNEAADAMKVNFQQEKIVDGIITATRLVGEKLKLHFPYSANDKNELTDAISEA